MCSALCRVRQKGRQTRLGRSVENWLFEVRWGFPFAECCYDILRDGVNH